MSRYIEGEHRHQSWLLPACLDDYVEADNPVRVIEAFVDELDLHALGFSGMIPAVTGRPAYHPATMLKLYIYGYLNRIQSSRRLERETQRNLELIWLLDRLTPDFKTIANFRSDSGQAIRAACRQFTMICRNLGLFSHASTAIDGSKFKAVNNRDKNFTTHKLSKRIEQIDESIKRYLVVLDRSDRDDSDIPETRVAHIKQKIIGLRQQIQYLKAMEGQVAEAADGQISLTDPDARSMATSGRGTGIVGYNVQLAVDTEHHLVIAHDVVNEGHDRTQLVPMGHAAKEAVGQEQILVLADRGYFNGEQVLECEGTGILPCIPRVDTSGRSGRGLFTKRDFIYNTENDYYVCPAGAPLTKSSTRSDRHGEITHYRNLTACVECSLKTRCTPENMKRLKRWDHEAVIDKMQVRLDQLPNAMGIRRRTVEHVFGTLKAWMGGTPLLLKTLPKVKTEISLSILAYNMRRMINMFGARAMIEAIRS